MYPLKICKVGNSLGLVLPKEAGSRLHVKEGDVVYLTDNQDGGFRITPSNHRVAEQLSVAEDIMRENHQVLLNIAPK